MNKTTIEIQFKHNGEVICCGEAYDVLDAEGKLAILARQYQILMERLMPEGDRDEADNEAVRETSVIEK